MGQILKRICGSVRVIQEHARFKRNPSMINSIKFKISTTNSPSIPVRTMGPDVNGGGGSLNSLLYLPVLLLYAYEFLRIYLS